MSEDLRVGVIGVGTMGADHAERLARRTARARLVAVADPDEVRAKELATCFDGVRSGADALELIAAGATCVQVGTATFNDPTAPQRVLAELGELAASHGVDRITDLVGIAHDRMVLP